MVEAEGRKFRFEGEDVLTPEVLETFPYEYPAREALVEIETDEWSCVCPFSRLPDYGTLAVSYVPSDVCIELKSGHSVRSMITAESVETLGLVVGESAYAVIKASSVLISSDFEGLRISAGNLLRGRVVSIRTDAVMGEVILAIGGGDTLAATVTAGGASDLGVSEGDEACAIIDASNVIIGVE